MMALAKEEHCLLNKVIERQSLSNHFTVVVGLGHPTNHAIHRWILSIKTEFFVLHFHVPRIHFLSEFTWCIGWQKLSKVFPETVHGHLVNIYASMLQTVKDSVHLLWHLTWSFQGCCCLFQVIFSCFASH